MKIQEFFTQSSILDLSFFNFQNAVTACYFADNELRIKRINENFRSFFPVLGNVTDAYMPDVLTQLGVPQAQISEYVEEMEKSGRVMIPAIEVKVDGEAKVFSLLSTRTHDDHFDYLNGVQGQFVDRTDEWHLRMEREALLEQKLQDRDLIAEKSKQLESLATRLAKYLSPQIYKSIFSDSADLKRTNSRKNLTVFLSDIVSFSDLTDSLEPEQLAKVVNSYLSEMASIAIECGGTIDKFIGDAILVFFGDPDTEGETEDALRCVEMAIRMRTRVQELKKYWQKQGAPHGLRVRMGVATGFCTVGNFGSEQRLDYTILGRPVNLAARLESLAEPDSILIDDGTYRLVGEQVA
ncbi:MAG: adenylate/guanylate cyclase domain-containing protein, partial [Alphaproteobacteria bacterium]